MVLTQKTQIIFKSGGGSFSSDQLRFFRPKGAFYLSGERFLDAKS